MKKIAFPNGKYFVEKKNITDTLFLSEGTATGWYKEIKNEIVFYNIQDVPMFAIRKPE